MGWQTPEEFRVKVADGETDLFMDLHYQPWWDFDDTDTINYVKETVAV